MATTRQANQSDEQLTGSVLKALAILECFTGHKEPQSPAEIAAQVGTSRPTAYRLLATLASEGWVMQDTSNPSKYRLGYKLLQIAGAYLEEQDLWQVARPTMEALCRRFNETVKLWVLDDVEVVYLGRVTGSAPLQSVMPIGSRGYLHSRAVGKAILAHLSEAEVNRIAQASGLQKRTAWTVTDLEQLRSELEQVRQRGYAVSDQEDVEGLRAVGAAILNLEGRPVGGLVMSNLVSYMPQERLATLGEALAEGCRQISRQLGYFGSESEYLLKK